MVNPSELRIGNVILFNDQPIIVHGLRTNGVMLDGVLYNTGDPLRQFDYQLIYEGDQRLRPLLLDDFFLEQILGRYQINNIEVFAYHRPNNGTYFINREEDDYSIGLYMGDQLVHITPFHFRYYHQLQNIHFAQYGEELDVQFETIRDRWNLMIGIGRAR